MIFTDVCYARTSAHPIRAGLVDGGCKGESEISAKLDGVGGRADFSPVAVQLRQSWSWGFKVQQGRSPEWHGAGQSARGINRRYDCMALIGSMPQSAKVRGCNGGGERSGEPPCQDA